MKIAVIGAGVSGLTASYLLSREHEVDVYEKAERIGGHTATIDVDWQGERHAIDTGFIVFNQRTYPYFIKLMGMLGVESQASSMGFSVSDSRADFEYAGNNLNALFAQRKNILSPVFLRMLYDIARFNRNALADLEAGRVDNDTRLGTYLDRNKYSQGFCEYYLIPMGSAIWSASKEQMRNFPLYFFVQFFKNHGLLSVFDKPTWRVLKNGSRSYLPALTAPFKERIHLNTNIEAVFRREGGVEIIFSGGERKHFDHIVFASHSDQALAMLGDPSQAELDVLGAIPYRENSVVLHTDTRLLPKRRATWSSWNYRLESNTSENLPCLTYNMNILQDIQSKHTFCVSLNADDLIDESKIIGQYRYAHPQFGLQTMQAQRKKMLVSGLNTTSYCGAYWANGFHEDGVKSAVDVAEEFGIRL